MNRNDSAHHNDLLRHPNILPAPIDEGLTGPLSGVGRAAEGWRLLSAISLATRRLVGFTTSPVAYAAVFGLWAAAYLFMAFVPLNGDEQFYAKGAGAIADYLKGTVSLAQFERTIVGYGWFMPGISIALSPLYLVFHGPHLWAIRLYASIFSLLLWRWTIREARSGFGEIPAAALTVFPALAFSWLLFTSIIYGDLVGGLVLTIVFARAFRIAVRAREPTPVSLKEVFVLELIMALATYLRGSLLLPVLCIHLFLAAIWLISGRWTELLPRLSKLAAGLVLFSVLLAPWSLATSKVLGEWVVTTSTVPLSLGITFGDPNKLCFGPCPEGNIWFNSAGFSRQYAEQFGLSELSVQRRMAASALENINIHDYVRQVRANLASFSSEPAQFSNRFVIISQFKFAPKLSFYITRFLTAEAVLFYAPFFLSLIIVNICFFPRETTAQIQILLLRLLTICLFVQPFVHSSHPRYWVAYAPLMGLSAGFLLRTGWRRPAWAQDPPADGREQPPSSSIFADRILFGLQVAYAVCVVLILTMVYAL